MQRALKQQRDLQRSVALVINFTDFSYPTSSDWETLGVKLVKYPCRGLPDNGTVNSFVYETMRFGRRPGFVRLVGGATHFDIVGERRAWGSNSFVSTISYAEAMLCEAWDISEFGV
jgi:hypothetical protein